MCISFLFGIHVYFNTLNSIKGGNLDKIYVNHVDESLVLILPCFITNGVYINNTTDRYIKLSHHHQKVE